MTDMLYNVKMTLRKVTTERTPRQMSARSLLGALENRFLILRKFDGERYEQIGGI